MARPKADAARLAPRLMLVTPVVSDGDSLAPALAAACAAADIAAVIVRLADADERTHINLIKALGRTVQDKDAALLVEAHPEIVARAGADGAHLSGTDALAGALPSLRPDHIAGAGALYSRHDAMTAAEEGADYVMFGEPDAAGHRPALEAVIERVTWWAEIFEIPCVAYAADLDAVEKLREAGADFVALPDAIWNETGALAEARAQIAVRERSV
jgi:thiamine-phosphate pyrophosphorylase